MLYLSFRASWSEMAAGVPALASEQSPVTSGSPSDFLSSLLSHVLSLSLKSSFSSILWFWKSSKKGIGSYRSNTSFFSHWFLSLQKVLLWGPNAIFFLIVSKFSNMWLIWGPNTSFFLIGFKVCKKCYYDTKSRFILSVIFKTNSQCFR